MRRYAAVFVILMLGVVSLGLAQEPPPMRPGYASNVAPITTYRSGAGNDPATLDDLTVPIINCTPGNKASLRVQALFTVPGATCTLVGVRWRKPDGVNFQATFTTTIPITAMSAGTVGGTFSPNTSSPVFDLGGEPYMSIRITSLSGGTVTLLTSLQ